MSIVAVVLSAAMVALCLLGVASPAKLIAVVRSFQNRTGLYAAAAVRLVLGVALFVAAPGSRAPDVLKVLGILIVVAGLSTPLFGLERFRRLLEWWSAQGAGFIRVWAAFGTAFGIYLIYALAA